MEVVTIPVITAIVYAFIEIIKTATNGAEGLKRYVPLIACALGVVCSMVAFYGVPNVLPTDNSIVAALLGAASGLAATGIYENVKNLFVKKGE